MCAIGDAVLATLALCVIAWEAIGVTGEPDGAPALHAVSARIATIEQMYRMAKQAFALACKRSAAVFEENCRNMLRGVAFLCVVAAAIAACSGTSDRAPGALSALPATRENAASPIKHVIIVIQENRSFNNLFANYPKALTKTTKIITSKHGTVNLTEVNLVPGVGPTPLHPDIAHGWGAYVSSYDNGKMDGFDKVPYGCFQNPNAGCTGLYPYQYVRRSTIQPYWDMAQQYVLADHMFQTQGSGSFTGHQDLIRGSTLLDAHESVIDNPNNQPWGCNAPAGTRTSLLTNHFVYKTNLGPRPCFTWKTMRDLLEAKGISWRSYVPVAGDEGNLYWNAFYAIHAVYYGPEKTTNISIPQTNILNDAKNGTLAGVSWVVPDALDSDHLGESSDSGPSWVAQIVNAVGSNPAMWKSTAIFVVWDDWGGIYDPVAPPQFNGLQPDYHGLGFRVPCIVVSAYAPKGVVAHTQFEFGSILKFVESNFSLGSLNTTDVRSADIGTVLNLKAAPRPFVSIAAKYPASYFLTRPPSRKPVDTQ